MTLFKINSGNYFIKIFLIILNFIFIGFIMTLPASAADIVINSIDPGATLKLNGVGYGAGSTVSVADGSTVVFETTFNGRDVTDTIESWYDIAVSIHAQHYDATPGTINLDTDLSYTPFDIFVIDSTDTGQFSISMTNKASDEAVKIIGFHAFVPNLYIDNLREFTNPTLSFPEAVASDADGNIYVADTYHHKIKKFDAGGIQVDEWGSFGTGSGQFQYPGGIVVSNETTPGVFVSDSNNHRIQKFDTDGNLLTAFGTFGTGDGELAYPYGLDISEEATITLYVADSYNHRIQKFDLDGNFLGSWGDYGLGNGLFNNPVGVAVTPGLDPTVFVTDYNNHLVQSFDATGTFEAQWGGAGSSNGQFLYPFGIDVSQDSSTSVYVVDTNNDRVQIFDADGNYIDQIGESGPGDGQFSSPIGVDVTNESSPTIYVSDGTNNRVQKFNSGGNFLLSFPERIDTGLIIYGTLENDGLMNIYHGYTGTGAAATNAIINKLVGSQVVLGGANYQNDYLIQELSADKLQLTDYEATIWRSVLNDQVFVDDWDGYDLNDELPTAYQLADKMVWFKTQDPAKWDLYPAMIVDSVNPYSWNFDNYDFGDYVFWEMHLAHNFLWSNDQDYNEYAHLLGPVNEMDLLDWTYGFDVFYLSFFADNGQNYYDWPRFEGNTTHGAGTEWANRLVDDFGFSEDTQTGSIYSPVSVLKLRDGLLRTEDSVYDYDTRVSLTNNQDLLILSDSDTLNFNFIDGVSFNQGANSHWVVEEGLTYLNDTPDDPAISITTATVVLSGTQVSVTAKNNYGLGGTGLDFHAAGDGDSTASTMYVAYRNRDDIGKQLTRQTLSYDSGTNSWTGVFNLPQGNYDLYVAAVENDNSYGKVKEYTIDTADFDLTGPIVTVSSPTHSDSNAVYSDTNPIFKWVGVDQAGIAGYSFTFDATATTEPDETIDSTATTTDFTNVGEGTWYFHIKGKDNFDNWGSAGHFGIQITTGSLGAWDWHGGQPLSGDLIGEDNKDDLISFYSYSDNLTRVWGFRSYGDSLSTPRLLWDSGIGNWHGPATIVVPGDFDGDGNTDLVGFYNYQQDHSIAWFFRNNGDGLDDPVNWWNSGVGNWNGNAARYVSGEFTGDDKADVIALYAYGQNQTRAFLFSGNGTAFNTTLWWDSGVGTWNGMATKIVAGDFNADNLDDMMGFYTYQGDQTRAWFFNNNGPGFNNPALWWDSGIGKWNGDSHQLSVGDFDGDDKTDVGSFYAYEGDHSRMFNFSNSTDSLSPMLLWDSGAGNWNGNETQVVSADMDGDGRVSTFEAFFNFGSQTTGIFSMGPTEAISPIVWSQEL